MKILFASSKEMNTDNMIERPNDINIGIVKENIDFIKSVNEEESYKTFKTKVDIYRQHQNINILSKRAIDLFTGISFRQLTDLNNSQLNDVMILSALYGFSYAFDYISFFRYDYTMKNSKTNRKEIYNEINKILENEDVVYNLSSKEFSAGIIHHNLIDFEFYLKKDGILKQHSVASKKLRGQLVNYICTEEKYNLKEFNYDDYYYNQELSDKNKYVYIRDEN